MPRSNIALIFGGSGQDGKILSGLLRANGYSVSIAPRFTHSDYASGALQEEIGSVRPSEIYYLSAVHGSSVDNINDNYGLIYDHMLVNSNIPSAIPSVLNNLGLDSSLFFASSSLVFPVQDELIDEDTRPLPESLYANSKLYTCLNLARARVAYGLPIVCGHLFTHESIYRSRNFLVQRVIEYALGIHSSSANKLRLSNLDQIIDLMDARDAMSAAFHCTRNRMSGDYIIAPGVRLSVRELVDLIFRKFGLDYLDFVEEYVYGASDNRLARVGNIKKLRSTGWSQKYSINDTISDIIEDKLSQDFRKTRYAK